MTNLKNFFSKIRKLPKDGMIYKISDKGYWSNLDPKTNEKIIENLEKIGTKNVISKFCPELYNIIFDEKRAAGLGLLELNGNEIAIDLGCMWGAITIPLARSCSNVVAVDQTLDSLKLNSYRSKEEKLDNLTYIQANLNKFDMPKSTFDVAVVNGVLEWLPETTPMIIDKKISFSSNNKITDTPRKVHLNFLQKVHSSLKQNGRLYLAIENSLDYKMFFGNKDPHSGLLFTSFLPRNVSNLISKLFRNRKYRTWIYNKNELYALLKDAGYTDIEIYCVWPDYRYPEFIINYKDKFVFNNPIAIRNQSGKFRLLRFFANLIERILFGLFKLKFFCPSFILIAKK